MNLTWRDGVNAWLFVLLLGIIWFGTANRAPRTPTLAQTGGASQAADLRSGGVALPIRWGDLGAQLVESGVIDRAKLEELYTSRGGLAPEEAALLDGSSKRVVLTEQNAGYLLNLFWALGLANKNPVLDEGPMQDPRYGGAARFASTGGWTLARGAAMDHYSMHPWIVLTEAQQELLERVAQGIYRPCCGNSAYFPDCNHGMAMLGFLELAASQGASEDELYRAALALNRAWFPDTYATIDAYLAKQGSDPSSADPKMLLGADFSSGAGYQRVLREVGPRPSQGGSCGV